MGRNVSHSGLRLRAATLAAAAKSLQRQSGASAPFSLVLMTDAARLPNPEPIIRVLPRGSAVILRDYADARRAATARRLLSICRARDLFFLIGGDEDLARVIGADGLHRPAHAPWPENRAGRLLTASAHDARELCEAANRGADAALLSPAFATGSHPGASALGPGQFKELAAAASLPVLALGGVDETNAALLSGPNVCGIAAISAFMRKA